MLTNDIKDGMRIRFWDGRTGVMRDNKRGIIRTVEISATGGFFNDVGSCYINEIAEVEVGHQWVKAEITTSHAKQLAISGIH
jgi:hypothetical protein